MFKATWKLARLPGFVFSLFVLICSACSTPEIYVEPSIDSDGDGIFDHLDSCSSSPPGASIGKDGCPLDTDGDGVPNYLDTCPDTPPGAAACLFGCELREPIVINLVNDEFDFDKYELKPDMKTRLDEFIHEFEAMPDPVDLTVVGHTDSIGTAEYNQALSLRRAQSVVDYLKANGLQDLAFEQRGEGESQPIAENETVEGRAKNRRVELFMHSSEQH